MTSLLVAVQMAVACHAQPGQPATAPARPFLVVNEEELDRLRHELAQPGWKADLYRAERGTAFTTPGFGIRSNADRWLERDITIPPRSGHYHLFFCKDGTRLEMPRDQKFLPGPYRCPHCGRTYRGEPYEGALRRVVHAWIAQAAWDLAMVAALEHKPEYAAKAAEILLACADAYPGPHTNATTGGMIYQSLGEAMWVIPLAQAYDLIYHTLTDEKRRTIEAFFRITAEGIQRCGTHGNWGSWHLSAVGVVGYAINAPELIDWATGQFKQQIRDQLGDDGLWPESVHCYHFFPLRAFMALAEAAWHAGTDLYHWQAKPGKSLMSMFTAPLQYPYPDLRLPAINDGWFEAFLPADCYELAYHRDKDPAFAWVLANGYKPGMVPAGTVNEPGALRRDGLYAFLFGGEIPPDVTPPAAVSAHFPVLGICAFRAPAGAMLTFDYGRFYGHGHLDKMGVTLFANGTLWSADYGTPGYGSAILPWYQSTFAHNTIVVDNRNQARTPENTAAVWLGDSDLEAARAQTVEAYPGVSHTRTVVRVRDYFVIADQLTSDTAHTYDFYFHAEGTLSLEPAAARPEPIAPPVAWLQDLQAHDPAETLYAQWTQGEVGLTVALTGSHAFTPIAGRCPAETGSRTIPILIARQTGNSAEFIAVLRPFKQPRPLTVTRTAEGIEIRQPQSQDRLALPPDGKPTLMAK